MKNNKGFTLIELLAVIVILAIIALIASPIIVGLIDDARKSAAANSAYGVYHSAENVYAKVLMKNSGNGLSKFLKYEFSDGSVAISASDDGLTGWTVMADDVAVAAQLGTGMTEASITLDYNGTKPTGGTLIINKSGKVTVETSLMISNFSCSHDGEEFECGND